AGVPALRRGRSTARSTVTTPSAMPGAALRPKRRSSAMALICGLIHRLAETVAHQTHERRRRRPGILAGRANMQDRAARRLYAHDLHWALGVHPRSVDR